jgi:hypothetical protein
MNLLPSPGLPSLKTEPQADGLGNPYRKLILSSGKLNWIVERAGLRLTA